MLVTSPEDLAWQAEMDKLRRMNRIAMLLHFVQGMGQFIISITVDAYKDSEIAMTSQYVNWTAGEGPVSKFGLVTRF